MQRKPGLRSAPQPILLACSEANGCWGTSFLALSFSLASAHNVNNSRQMHALPAPSSSSEMLYVACAPPPTPLTDAVYTLSSSCLWARRGESCPACPTLTSGDHPFWPLPGHSPCSPSSPPAHRQKHGEWVYWEDCTVSGVQLSDRTKCQIA